MPASYLSPLPSLAAAIATFALVVSTAGCPAPGGYGKSPIEPNVEKLKASENPCDQVVVEVCKAFPECGLWRASFEYGEQMAAAQGRTTCQKLLMNGPMMKAHVALAKRLVANASFATDWPKDGVFKSACTKLLNAACEGVEDCAPFRKMFMESQRGAGAQAEETCTQALSDPRTIRQLNAAAKLEASRAKTPAP